VCQNQKGNKVQKYEMSKWFAQGACHVVRYRGSDVLLFSRHGKSFGTARHIPHVKRYVRNGVEYASLAALLRAVEAESNAERERN